MKINLKFMILRLGFLVIILVITSNVCMIFKQDKTKEITSKKEIINYLNTFTSLYDTILKDENNLSFTKIEYQSDIFSIWFVLQMTADNKKYIPMIVKRLDEKFMNAGWKFSNDANEIELGDIKINTVKMKNSMFWRKMFSEKNDSSTNNSVKLYFDKDCTELLLIYREDGN